MTKIFYLFFLIFFIEVKRGDALEIDRTLRFSILNVSSSKKTLLINKGKEDGLKKGDQAKFYRIEKNIIARAIVIKVSATRSLWSVFKYRHKKIIKKNVSLILTITRPLPLTNDISKKLFKNDVFSGKGDRIPTVFKNQNQRILSRRFLTQNPKGDFNSINEMDRPKKRKIVDYSRLNDLSSKSQYKIKVNYQSLKEKKLGKSYGKIGKSNFSSLNESRLSPKLPEKIREQKYKNLDEI
jgi:hypothetical protein